MNIQYCLSIQAFGRDGVTVSERRFEGSSDVMSFDDDEKAW
jgi:hypothetical protein